MVLETTGFDLKSQSEGQRIHMGDNMRVIVLQGS